MFLWLFVFFFIDPLGFGIKNGSLLFSRRLGATLHIFLNNNSYQANPQYLLIDKMQKISQNYTQQQPHSFTDKQTHHQEMQPITKITPLYFTMRINGQYYVSYQKNQFWMLIFRSVVLLVVNIVILYILSGFDDINDTIQDVVRYALLVQSVLHVMLCFLDPGTIFQDEDDSFDQERIYCLTCTLYRLRSSKHCTWCNKCVKRYDHHCGVFGKCIGKRNLIVFWLFITITALQFPVLIILFIFHILKMQ